MKQYMFIFTLPGELGEEFVSLIPRQRAHINRLLEEGVVRSYTLALDRSKLWAIIEGKSEEEVRKIVDQFPLRKFVEVAIVELAFHNTAISPLLALSMN